MTNQEQIISADCYFPNLRGGFNLPRFPSTEKQELTGLPFSMKSLCCIPHTSSTSLQKPCTAVSHRARQRPQAGRSPCAQGPNPSPTGSLITLKRHSNSPPCCSMGELLQETLDEPTLTPSVCLKAEGRCEGGRFSGCHWTISQFTNWVINGSAQ